MGPVSHEISSPRCSSPSLRPRRLVTAQDWGLLAARVLLGVVFAAHGAQKLFGAFGGSGLTGIVGMLGPVGYLMAVGEFFGGLGIALGILSRFSAAANAVVMLGAIAMIHGPVGFFMNWTGSQAGEGYEFHLVAIAALIPILIAGPGRLALGRVLVPERAGRRLQEAFV